MYKSQIYIEEFYKRVSYAAEKLSGTDYQIILVNDGSPDKSLEIAKNLADQDKKLIIVDLSKNFGHHKAIMTGLRFAEGEKVFLIDIDLEEQPEWLISFNDQLEQENCDVVYGVQEKRKGNLLERFTGYIFYKIFRAFTGIMQPDNITTARLMTKDYVRSLLLHKEKEINIGGLYLLTGFNQSPQKIQKLSNSPTTYSFSHKISHFINAISSFSSLPLRFSFYIGSILFISAVFFILYLVFLYSFYQPPEGYISIIASIWMFSGLIILANSIQGIYLSKVFMEVKKRPLTIIKEVYQNKDA